MVLLLGISGGNVHQPGDVPGRSKQSTSIAVVHIRTLVSNDAVC